MYVLSNGYGIGGATCLIYPNIMPFMDRHGIGDCVILPSSVHEVILLKGVEFSEAGGLVDMVKEVNETQVPPDEVLSENVYFYSEREKRIFKI